MRGSLNSSSAQLQPNGPDPDGFGTPPRGSVCQGGNEAFHGGQRLHPRGGQGGMTEVKLANWLPEGAARRCQGVRSDDGEDHTAINMT